MKVTISSKRPGRRPKAGVPTRRRNPQLYLIKYGIADYTKMETPEVQHRVGRLLGRLLAADVVLAGRGQPVFSPKTREAMTFAYQSYTETERIEVKGGGRGGTKKAQDGGQPLNRPNRVRRNDDQGQPLHLDLRTKRASDH